MRKLVFSLGLVSIALLLAVSIAMARAASPDGVSRAESCNITQSRSISGGAATTVTFINSTTQSLAVYWLNYQGSKVLYRWLLPGQSYHQPTYAGNPWVVLDSGGTCWAYTVAGGSSSTVRVGNVADPFTPHYVDQCLVTQNYSLNSDYPTTLEIANQTNMTVNVYWLNYSGGRVFYKSLGPGQRYTQQTYKTHPFEVMSQGGQCLGFAVAGVTTSLTVTTVNACPNLYVIDSRGSGEDGGTISPPAQKFIDALKSLEPGKSVKAVPNGYPARGGFNVFAGAFAKIPGAYLNSVDDGEAWLRDAIAKLSVRCRQAKVILTGYSQGAQVTGDVIQRDGPFKNVIGVVLFGDPYFNSRDARVDRGNFRIGPKGSLGSRPKYAFAHVLSYCHANDPVCQFGSNPRYGWKFHENYDQLGEPAAAASVAARW